MSDETKTAVVPVDTGPNFSDSTLPEAMIRAGMAVQDQVAEDNANYVAGETTDWDQGMVAVAIYRAMLAAAPEALATDPAEGRWYAAEDIDRMVREIDVALNGDGAAQQAKLCDVFSQIIALANRDPQGEEPVAYLWEDVLPGRKAEVVWRVAINAEEVENLRSAGVELRPLGFIASPQDDRMGVADEDGWINGKWCCNPVPGVRITARGEGFVHAGFPSASFDWKTVTGYRIADTKEGGAS